jgi:hypothetical protein
MDITDLNRDLTELRQVVIMPRASDRKHDQPESEADLLPKRARIELSIMGGRYANDNEMQRLVSRLCKGRACFVPSFRRGRTHFVPSIPKR